MEKKFIPIYSKNDKECIYESEDKKNSSCSDLQIPLLGSYSERDFRFINIRNTSLNPYLLANSKRKFRFSVINYDTNFESKFNENEVNLEENFTFKKLLIISLFVMISSIQLTIYRKSCFDIKNIQLKNYQSINNLFFEMLIYSWRIQIIFLFFLLHLLISRILNLNKISDIESTDKHFDLKRKLSISPRNRNINSLPYLNSNRFPSNSFNLHFSNRIKLEEWRNILNFANLKYAVMNYLSSGLIFLSTNFLPFSLIMLFNSLNLIITHVFHHKFNKKLKIHLKILISFFTFLSLSILIKNFFFDKEKLIGIFLCIISIFIKVYYTQSLIKESLETYFPLDTLFILYFNSFVVSSIVMLIVQFFVFELSAKSYFFVLFGWLINNEDLLSILNLGLIAFINFIIMILIPNIINSFELKILKYIEIPINDLMGIYFLSSYSSPYYDFSFLNYNNITCMIQILVCIFIVDFRIFK